jgi:predicted ATPase
MSLKHLLLSTNADMEKLPYLQQIALKREKIEDDSVYPFNLSLVKSLTTLRFAPQVTFIVGENGSGKSTLIEAIAVAMGFNPEGGSKNFNFTTRSSHSQLADYLKLACSYKRPKDGFFLRAESFFNVATNIEDLDKEFLGGPKIMDSFGKKSLHEQSHGESFLSLVLNRFYGNGLYILDEPESALSPTRQMSLIARMAQLIRQNSQFIIATHSPILMAYPNALIYQISEEGISQVDYKDTEHYFITQAFLNNPEKMLNELIKEN